MEQQGYKYILRQNKRNSEYEEEEVEGETEGWPGDIVVMGGADKFNYQHLLDVAPKNWFHIEICVL